VNRTAFYKIGLFYHLFFRFRVRRLQPL
jgi:hypothetical protein